LNGAFSKIRSNSLSTSGCGDKMHTISFEDPRFVFTCASLKENWPKGQGPLADMFLNCY